MKIQSKSLQKETKKLLPFEDNTFFNKTPLYIKVKKANEKDLIYLQNNKEQIEKNKKYFEQYKEYTNIKKDFDFNKYLYHICDIGNGTYTPHIYCAETELRSFIRKNFDNRDYYYKKPKFDKKYYLFDTNVVDDILIYRFFVFKFDKKTIYKENENKGFYEVFRICFFNDVVWLEDREKIYNFDYEYIIYSNKIHNYGKFICADAAKTNKNILETYPYILSTTIYGEYKNNNIQPTFKSFVFNFSKLYKAKNIYKSIPNYIQKDLIKNKKNKLPKKLIKQYENEYKWYNQYIYAKIYTKKEEDNPFVLFSCFINGLEIERIYITKQKIYKFGYNFFKNKWVSIRKKKLNILDVDIKNIFFCKNYNKEIINETLLKRTSFLKYISSEFKKEIQYYNRNSSKTYPLNCPFSLLFLELNCKWIEQALKMNFYNLILEMICKVNVDFPQKKIFFQKQHLLKLKQNNTYIENKTIKPIKKNKYFMECLNKNWIYNESLKNYLLSTKEANNIYNSLNLYEALNVSPKMLKHIKDDRILSYETFVNRTKDDFYTKKFKEKDHNLWLKVCMLSIEDKSIKKIIKILEDENKNICSFFVNLLKNDSPERLINRYMDYLKFRVKANMYGAFNYPLVMSPSDIDFLHDRAYRDYMYQKDIEKLEKRKNREQKRKSMEEKFSNVVKSEDYLQFVDEEPNKKYSILPANEPMDLINEGKNLSHCVGSYTSAMSNGKSYIYFLRKNEDLEEAFYTLEIVKIKNYNYKKEINKEKNDKKDKEKPYIYKLKQCYGYRDTTTKSRDCKTFIQDWAKRKNVKIGCVL